MSRIRRVLCPSPLLPSPRPRSHFESFQSLCSDPRESDTISTRIFCGLRKQVDSYERGLTLSQKLTVLFGQAEDVAQEMNEIAPGNLNIAFAVHKNLEPLRTDTHPRAGTQRYCGTYHSRKAQQPLRHDGGTDSSDDETSTDTRDCMFDSYGNTANDLKGPQRKWRRFATRLQCYTSVLHQHQSLEQMVSKLTCPSFRFSALHSNATPN